MANITDISNELSIRKRLLQLRVLRDSLESVLRLYDQDHRLMMSDSRGKIEEELDYVRLRIKSIEHNLKFSAKR